MAQLAEMVAGPGQDPDLVEVLCSYVCGRKRESWPPAAASFVLHNRLAPRTPRVSCQGSWSRSHLLCADCCRARERRDLGALQRPVP
jgi:hypothetical protein